jgi:hypothetical protein
VTLLLFHDDGVHNFPQKSDKLIYDKRLAKKLDKGVEKNTIYLAIAARIYYEISDVGM